MSYPATRLFLAISGAIGLVIGISILFLPHAFFASNQVSLGTDPNLLSEIRAPGGVLLAAGAIMIYGALKARFFRMALLTGALVFGMYGASRIISIVLDGIPSSSLIGALVVELIVSGAATIMITKFGTARSEF